MTDGVVTKYYYAGATRIAIPQGDDVRKNGTLYYLLGDHLGSTGIVTFENGNLVSQTKYKAWGEVRHQSGPSLTEYTYTGQFSYTGSFGLMFYNARWYDPALGRFAQADSIVPPGVQGLDRYAYVGNSPINYSDPSGHCRMDSDMEDCYSAGKNYTKYYSALVKQNFGVTLKGEWNLKNTWGMYQALSEMDSALPGGISRFTSGTEYYFSYNPNQYGGRTNEATGNISFWSYDEIPYQNIYHEVTHSIDIRSGEYFTNLLESKKIYTSNNEFVMGGPANGYSRNSLGYAETYILDPTGRLVEAEQHTATSNCSERIKWCLSGNNADEELADLVANYVAGNYVADPTNPFYEYGVIRKNWVFDAFLQFP